MLRIDRRDIPAWQINQRNADAKQRDAGAINKICQLKQINQRNTVVILRAVQQNTVTILNLMKIDFESFLIKLRDNRFIIGSEIRKILHFSENTGKPLNKK
jgi:flagellar biosynthesis/type III secretory pathway chaperone